MPDNQVEIEVALRDSASSVLKDIGRQIDIVSKKMADTGKTGVEAFDRIKKSAQSSREDTAKSNASLTGMSGIMSSMAKTLLSPIGLAAGFVAVERALGRFAGERVQLQAMTADVGMTTGGITVMQRTLARMNLSAGEAQGVIQNLGGQVKELATYKVDSELFGNLVKMGEGEFAKKLLATAESGDFDAAVKMMIHKYGDISKRSSALATYYARNVIHENEYVLKSYEKTSEGVEASYEMNYEESQKYLDKQEEIHNRFATAVTKTVEVVLTGLNEMDTGFSSLANKIRDFVGLDYFKAVPQKPGQSVAPEIRNETTRIQMGLPALIQGPQQQQRLEGRQAGGPAFGGRAYVVGERGPELFVPSQSGQVMMASFSRSDITVKEMSDTEKESNRTLHDVLDVLKKMDDPVGYGGAAGGAPGGGGSGGFPPGIRGGGGGASSGGSTGGSGGPMPKGQAAKNAQVIYDTLRSLGHTHEQASAALAHAEAESGFNPSLPGDNNTSLGLWQWRDARDTKRRTAMFNFAKERGLDWRDPKTQAMFFDWDLRHGEGSHAGKSYFGSKSAREATRALDSYERFRGWQQGQPGRYRSAEKFAGRMHEGGTPEATPQADTGGDTLYPRQPGGGLHQTEAGMDPELRARLLAMKKASPYGGAGLMGGRSGYRTYEEQVDIYKHSRPGYAARPGTSQHGHGLAGDLHYQSEAERQWYHQHAGEFGVNFPMGHEPWHAQKDPRYAGRQFIDEQQQEARRKMDQQSRAKTAARNGTVTASVDFGAMGKRETDSYGPFKVLKIPSSRQNKPVREGEVVYGDPGYSPWTN